jgi:hypothetical protein
MTFKGQASRFQSFNVSMVTQGPGFKVSEFQGFNVAESISCSRLNPLSEKISEKRNRPPRRAIGT